jgi:CheY-like chemotaxis protein
MRSWVAWCQKMARTLGNCCTLRAGGEPVLIFTEIDMPYMNGFQFIECVKRQHELKHIPIIVYTNAVYYLVSKNFQPIKEKCLELGVLQVNKPSSFEDLAHAINDCLESHKIKIS